MSQKKLALKRAKKNLKRKNRNYGGKKYFAVQNNKAVEKPMADADTITL